MNFADDIKKFTVKVASNSDEVIRRTVFGIMESIDMMSPVGNPSLWQIPEAAPEGYVGGHFRANWQLGIDSLAPGIIEGHDYKGALDREKAKMPEKAGGHVFYYGNNLPYAQALEDGHSQGQAPLGMVGITTVRFGGIVEEAAAKVNK